MSVLYNFENDVKIQKLRLTNEETFYNCFLDNSVNAPRGFIAVRTIEPKTVTYIKVANILFFEVEERTAARVYEDFDVLPETVRVNAQ